MAATEADYGVDVYQLNVGAGDAAIYVQFRTSTKTLLSAVLVDGGDKQGNIAYFSPWAQIERTMEQIKQDYKLTTPLKFNAIVATHWDSDHTKGLVELIVNDLQLGITKDPSYNQVSFMKYDPTTGDPQTVFYFPFWRSKDSKSGLNGLVGAEQKYTAEMRKMKDDKGKEIDKLQFTVRLRKEIKPVDPPPTGPKPPPTFKWEDTKVDNICLVRHTPETMLGVDFFANGLGLGNKYKDMKYLDDLLKSEEAAVDKNLPAMFCVATDRHMLGTAGSIDSGRFATTALVSSDDGPEAEAAPVASPEPDIVTGDAATEADPAIKAPRITKGTTSAPNQVSIVTLIVWRTSKRISYYASGDLDAAMEAEIVDWTKRPVPMVGNYPVRVVKASHHGAAGSFPPNMLVSWNPTGIIFTCGRKYFHPGMPPLPYLLDACGSVVVFVFFADDD
jgi:beta-lactamase superfamily II metal-dependent hydrolase